MNGQRPLSEQDAQDIYAILVAMAKAPDHEWAVRQFVDAQTRDFCPEYRFGGALGFGGKFWRNGGRLYVTCYQEDETASKKKLIAKTNEALTRLQLARPSLMEGVIYG